jgi:hypothetical protein
LSHPPAGVGSEQRVGQLPPLVGLGQAGTAAALADHPDDPVPALAPEIGDVGAGHVVGGQHSDGCCRSEQE